ncbi:MAG: hypothetical protein H0V25_06630 [Solirubrobacterales bacterium]|nr:hypothetical protein [Solirubrobacterales bacterium]
MEETFPDIGAMSDEDLKQLIDSLTRDERQVSYERRMLHGKIDILRAELVSRLRTNHEAGDALISRADVEKLTQILSGQVDGPDSKGSPESL